MNTPGWTIHRMRSSAAAHPRSTRLLLAAFFIAVLAGSLLTRGALSQSAPGTAERFRRMSEDFEQKGLAEPFKGITTASISRPACSRIRSTGVSTGPVRQAAESFFAGLTPEQRAQTTFPADDPEWRKWMNQHFYVRQGVNFKEMNAAQRDQAFALYGPR